jgi:RNA polymerase sporulation-specific sigma factor
MKDSISMFEPIYNEGTDTIYLCDQLNDKKGNYYDQDLKISLNDALNHIKDKEKYILLNRYIYGKTQTELSFELGISQAQISRLEKNAVEDIKRLIL